MTRERDTDRPAEAGVSVVRLALVIPGALLFERLLTDWAPRAGIYLADHGPAWTAYAVSISIVGGLGLWVRLVAREEVSR